MLKINEVKLGNFLLQNIGVSGKPDYQYRKVDISDLVLLKKSEDHNVIDENYRGVPITSEILGKAGFILDEELIPSRKIWVLKDWPLGRRLRFYLTENKNFFFWQQTDFLIVTLHQLQNLFSDLTTDELKIDLPSID